MILRMDTTKNGSLDITSINPKPTKVPVEVKIKEPTINDAFKIDSSSGRRKIIAWKHAEFPITGDYQIDNVSPSRCCQPVYWQQYNRWR